MIILDTHVFIWLVDQPEHISRRARKILSDSDETISISIMSSWEIALLHKRRRLDLPDSPNDFIEFMLAHHGLEELPLSREVIFQSALLPDIHKDPFDRILIAEAMIRNAALITKDKTIAKYPGIQTIW